MRMKNLVYSKKAAIVTTICDGIVFIAMFFCVLDYMSAYARPIAIGLSILLLAYEIFEYIHMTGTALWAQSEEKKKETYSYLVRMRIFFYINVPFAFGATYVSGNIKIMFNIITGIALVYCVIYYVKFMLSK